MQDSPKLLSPLETLQSVLMSFLGVQKESVRQRDFQRGRMQDFIVMGVAVTVVFVLLLIGLVKLILYFAVH